MILALLFTVAAARADVDLSDMPIPTTAEQAEAGFAERGRRVVEAIAADDLGTIEFHNGGHFATVAAAKLALGRDAEAVNRILLAGKAYSKPGTDFHDLGKLCARDGDYDFLLSNLVPVVIRHWDAMWPETRDHLMNKLLTVRGNKVSLKLSFCGLPIGETENHVLMTETSRYLTNQLWMRYAPHPKYDNEKNGMNAWMLRHLQTFLKTDFFEYNSRPYQGYAIMPIQNLYELAEDPRVKLAALNVLDYLTAKFAVSSDHLRRQVPFRRQPQYRVRTDMLPIDGETHRFLQFTGDTTFMPNHSAVYGIGFMMHAALGAYRPPRFLLDLILNKPAYLQHFHHTGFEAYASSKSFLISAGGVWADSFDMFTHVNSGWPVATTLMPTDGGTDASDFIRIDGGPSYTGKVNSCIAPGFACGIDPVLPASVPAQCRTRVESFLGGTWTFVDFPHCGVGYPFYAAVFEAPCDSRACRSRGKSFGFFEAAEMTTDFTTFRNRVLANNEGREFHSGGTNEYVTSDGRVIPFTPLTKIKDALKGPLARGDVMEGAGDGKVIVRHPVTGESLTLDLSDPLHPKRTEGKNERNDHLIFVPAGPRTSR